MHHSWPGGLLTGGLFSLSVCLGGVLSISNDHVDRVLGFSFEVAVQDVLGPVGVSLLRIERGSRDYVLVWPSGVRTVGDHGIATTEGVSHLSPGVILWCRLYVYGQRCHLDTPTPDVASVTIKVTAF